MKYSKNELIISTDIVKNFENKWIEKSQKVFDDIKYNVYQGVGEASLVKLLIKEELAIKL